MFPKGNEREIFFRLKYLIEELKKMASKLKILIDFKQCLINFLDELIDQFPEEGDLVVIRIFLNDQMPIEQIMNIFIAKVLPCKKIVKERNDSFFVNQNEFFGNLNKDKVNHFKMLWLSDKLDADDRNVIWKWYDAFINLAEKYQLATN